MRHGLVALAIAIGTVGALAAPAGAAAYQPDIQACVGTKACAYIGSNVYSPTPQVVGPVPTAKGAKRYFTVFAQSDGTALDAFLIKGPPSTAQLQVKYYDYNTVPPALLPNIKKPAGMATPFIGPGLAVKLFIVEVKPTSLAVRNTVKSVGVRLTSTHGPADVIVLKVKVV